jgi:hypothetical protein
MPTLTSSPGFPEAHKPADSSAEYISPKIISAFINLL